MKKKRFLAIFLVLTMLVSLMPMGFAADEEEVVVEETEEVVEEAVVPEEGPEDDAQEPEEYLLEDESSVDAQDASAPPTVRFVAGEGGTGDGLIITNPEYEEVGGKTFYWVKDADILTAQTKVSKEGHTFAGWDIDVDEDHKFEAPASGEKVVTATWSPISYAVTFTGDPQANVDALKTSKKFPVDTTVPYGTALATYIKNADTQQVEEADLKYQDIAPTFKVNDEEKTFAQVQAYTVTGPTTVEVIWTVSGTWDVVFDYDGSTPIVGQPDASGKVTVKVDKGGKIPANSYNPAPTKEGHTFKAWTPANPAYGLDTPVNGNESFKATFDIQKFNVYFDGYPDKTQEDVSWGSFVTTTDPEPVEGQVFSGWSTAKGDKDKIVDLRTYKITKVTTFYPIFGVVTHSVSFNLAGGVEVEENQFATQKIEDGKKATDPGAPFKLGYHLTGWKDAAGKTFSFNDAIVADKVLTAQWEGNTYELEIDCSKIDGDVKYDGTKITKPVVDTIAVYNGTFFDVKALTAQGYQFEGYEYTVEGATEPTHVSTGPLTLVEDMPFTGSGNTYRLVLTPVIQNSFWEVTFNTNGHGPSTIPSVKIQKDRIKTVSEPNDAKETLVLLENSVPTFYLDGWYEVTVPQQFTDANKWDFSTVVDKNVSLIANWLPVKTATFTLSSEDTTAVWSGEDTGAQTASVVRYVPEGKTLAEMAEIQKTHTDTLSTYKFTLPTATKVGSNKLSWLIGGSESNVFTESTKVEDNMNATSKFNTVTWTLTFDAKGGTLVGFNDKIEGIPDNTTIEKPGDVEKTGCRFDGWFYTKADGSKAEFTFGVTLVTSNLDLVAAWTEYEAAIVGGDNYPTLQLALNDAAGKTVTLYKDVEVATAVLPDGNVTFDFGSHKLSGANIQIADGNTLTIKSGTFEDCTFAGEGTVTVSDGKFLNNKFTATTVGFAAAGKLGEFDAVSARNFNNKLDLTTSDNMLALVGNNAYYTAVLTLPLTFNYNHDPAIQPTQVIVYAGQGETAAHAIAEQVERGKLSGGTPWTDNITDPKFDPSVTTDKFDKWTVGGTAFDLNATLTAAPTEQIKGTWSTRYAVTFYVNGVKQEGVGFEEYNQLVEKGKKATFVDPSGVISQYNKSQSAANQEEFEYWVATPTDQSKPIEEFDFDTPITKNYNLEARMKGRIIFDYQDASMAPVVIQAAHNTQLKDYDLPTAPEGVWVDKNRHVLNSTDYIDDTKDIYVFYPLYESKENWDVIDAALTSGFHYDVDPTGIGVITYKGTADGPILIDQSKLAGNVGYRATPDTLKLGFAIEAPSTVKKGQDYQIQFGTGAWTDFEWETTTSVNNNQVVKVEKTFTVDAIKAAAKNKEALEFSFAFRAKGSEEVAASFTATLDPQYVKFVFKAPTTDPYHLYKDGTDVFLISDYKYQNTVSFNTDGGEPATITPVTKDYGEPFLVSNKPNINPAKVGATFLGWDNEQGEHVYVVEGDKFTPFIINKDETLTAQYNETPVTVAITNGDGSRVVDTKSYVQSDSLSKVLAVLPEPAEQEDMTFLYWGYLYAKEGDTEKYKALPEDATTPLAELIYSNVVTIEAQYVANDTITFYNLDGSKELLVVGKPSLDNKGAIVTYPASAFYTDEAKALEGTIPHFQYWTVTAPNDNTAPEKFDFDKQTNIVKATDATNPAAIKLYPVTTPINVTFKYGEQTLKEGTVISGQSLADAIKAGTVVVPRVNVPAGQDYYWTDAEPSTWTKDIPAEYNPTTVPEDDVVLYAFAHSEKVDVTFYTAMGAEGIVKSVPFGEAIPADAYPTITDPNFKGLWSTVAYGTQTFPQAFDKGTKIIKETSLWAVFDEAAVEFENSLNLQEQIGIRMKITIPEGAKADDYTVNVSYESPYQTVNKTMKLSTLPVISGKYDFFPVYVGSDEMTYDLTVTVTKDGKEVGKKVVSIASIAEEKMQEERTQSDAKLMLIYKTLLQYGYYAQQQFGTHLDKLPTIPEGTTLSTIPSSYAVPDVEGFRISPGLDSAVTMWIKVKPAEGLTISDYSFKITKGNAVVTPDIAPKMVGGEIWVGLYLWSDFMNDDYVITVTAKGESATYTRCMDNALYNYQAKGTAVQIAQALYTYSEAVDAYFNA